MLEGAFAFVIMTANRIYACRDKYGLRPLAIGRLGDGWVVSSETCAFDAIGAELVRDVAPGEIVTIDEKGLRSCDYSQYKRSLMCSMEYIYFARPDSDIEGATSTPTRKESGRLLCRSRPPRPTSWSACRLEPQRRMGYRGERTALRDVDQEQIHRPHLHPATQELARRACG